MSVNTLQRVHQKFKKEADEINELKKEMDKWFNSLTVNQRLDLARDMWDKLNFEGKKEIYFID